MRDLLLHPAVQGGAAPLVAALAAALLLCPLRLSGLAAACGFFTAVHLTHQLDFDKRLLVVALGAPLLGALVDLALRPTRAAGVVLGIVFGLAAFWIFLNVLAGLPARRLVLYALAITAFVAVTVALSFLSQHEPLRAGAAGVGLGLGAGISVMFLHAKLLGLWAFALAAGSAGFLLAALLLPRRVAAGAAFTLSTGVIGALLACAVVVQSGLRWHYAALLALVPLAVRMPLPRGSAPAQALVALLYALAAAGGVCALVWTAR